MNSAMVFYIAYFFVFCIYAYGGYLMCGFSIMFWLGVFSAVVCAVGCGLMWWNSAPRGNNDQHR